MTTFVLDTGALIALDRGDRRLWARLYTTDHLGGVQVPAGAIAQAWRGSPRQAPLARALKLSDEVPLDGRHRQDRRRVAEASSRAGPRWVRRPDRSPQR